MQHTRERRLFSHMDFRKSKPGREANFPLMPHLFVPNLDAICYIRSRTEGNDALAFVKELLQGLATRG